MQPSHLRDDELLYELKLRKIPKTIQNTKERREAERALLEKLREEKKSYKLWPQTANDSAEEELPVCFAKATELNELLAREANLKDTAIRGQIYSRFCHVETRISRVTVGKDESLKDSFDETVKLVKSLREKFPDRPIYRAKITDEILKQLEDSTKIDGSIEISDETRKKLKDLHFTFDSSEEEAFSDEFSEDDLLKYPHSSTFHERQRRRRKPTSDTSNSSKSLPVHKWDIKFNGSREGMVVLDFIKRVKFLATSENVKLDDLIRSAYHLFREEAQIWYEANHRDFKTWGDLEFKLKEDFLPRNYKRILEKQLLERKQKSGESFSIFLAHMNTLFSKLEKEKSELEKIDVLRDNLRQTYRDILGIQLGRISTVNELKDICLEAENLYPDCLKPDVKKVQREIVSEVSTPISITKVPMTRPLTFGQREPERKFTCWNCGSEGHASRDCTSPKTIHCHRCGEKNVTVRNCPRCSKN